MKLVALHIENFMGLVGDHSLDLADLGLVHIAGRNDDDPGNSSNGSCKSTILEALTWGLFGEGLPRPQGNTEQGVRADEVLNDRMLKQCRVVVELEDDHVPIRVERWRKWKEGPSGRMSNGQRLAVGGEYDEALDEKETNRLICQAIGITRAIWCRGVVFGQESGFNFCDATAKQRTEILTTVMALEEIDSWHERCRDERRALTTKLAGLDGRLVELRSQREQLDEDAAQAAVDAWELGRLKRVAASKLQLVEVQAVGEALVQQRVQLNPIPEMPSAESLSVPDEISEAYRSSEAIVRGAQASLSRAESDLTRARQALDQVVAFGQRSACPTCGQGIGKEHQATCAAAAEETVAGAQSERDGFARAYQAVQAAAKPPHAVYQASVVSSERARAQFNSDRLAVQRLTEDHRRADQGVATARADWTRASALIDSISAEINPHEAFKSEIRDQLERNSEYLKAAVAEQGVVAKALDTAIWWDKEIPRFRTWMFDSVVDVLAGEANRWLGIMSGGVIWIQISTTKQVGKRIKDELDVRIYRWNPDGTITSRPYRVWSGGEKRRVALAVDLGLSRLMAQRASKAYKFIALDEIDRHLDDAGRSGLRLVLDQLREERESVLVISHDAEFKASFDQEITVSKSAGRVSILTGVQDGR